LRTGLLTGNEFYLVACYLSIVVAVREHEAVKSRR
jgi:hypothetical protein